MGVPFSDPAADGPVIQRADERALAQGVDIFKVFELVRKIRNNVEVPMVFLLYYNVMVHTELKNSLNVVRKQALTDLLFPICLMKKAMNQGIYRKIRCISDKPCITDFKRQN